MVKVHSRGRTDMTERAKKRLAELEERDRLKQELHKKWLEELGEMAGKHKKAQESFRKERYEIVRNIYAKFVEIENSGDVRNDFYQNLRIELLERGFKIQKNTPDAGLLIRLVLAAENLSASLVNKYSNAMRYAHSLSVTPADFFDWVKKNTITGASKQELIEEKERNRQRLERARILILNYLDWRETHPFAALPMYEQQANKYVNSDTQLVVMIGTAVRRFDRRSHTAEIYISHIMPPNLDIDVRIIDSWAKFLNSDLEEQEEAYRTKGLDVWAEEFHDKLWEHDVAVAEKLSVNWMLRQQAAMAEDQQAFAKEAAKFKKERAKSVKTAKISKK